MTIIEQLKAEIERLIESQTQYFNSMGGPTNFDIATLGWVLEKISTLESEKPNDQVVEGEVILNGHGLLVDVTKWGDGHKLKVIIKED